MMALRVQLDPGAFLPERAHATDAGADLRTPVAFTLSARSSHTIPTGVHIELPDSHYAKVASKSSLNVLHDIICDGTIDQGYSGEIAVRLHNLGDRPYRFDAGDKIAQLIVQRVEYPSFVQVERICGGERGDGGFGSTGK